MVGAVFVTMTIMPLAASAHVTVDPPTASKGGYGTFRIKVPSHDDVQNTVKVELEIPQDHPITSVQVAPTPGWTYTLEKTTLDQPADNHGSEITEVVSKITWEGGQIKPNEFEEFRIGLGPLPDDVDTLTLKTIQTYDGGKVAKWIEEAVDGEEPESPAPVITLLSVDDADHSATSDSEKKETAQDDDEDSDSNALVFVGIGLGAVALLAGIGALVKKK